MSKTSKIFLSSVFILVATLTVGYFWLSERNNTLEKYISEPPPRLLDTLGSVVEKGAENIDVDRLYNNLLIQYNAGLVSDEDFISGITKALEQRGQLFPNLMTLMIQKIPVGEDSQYTVYTQDLVGRERSIVFLVTRRPERNTVDIIYDGEYVLETNIIPPDTISIWTNSETIEYKIEVTGNSE